MGRKLKKEENVGTLSLHHAPGNIFLESIYTEENVIKRLSSYIKKMGTKKKKKKKRVEVLYRNRTVKYFFRRQ